MFEFWFTHPLWAYRAGTFGFASAWPRWVLLLLIGLAVLVVCVSLRRRRHLRYLGASRLVLLGGMQAALAALLLTLLWRPVLTVERVRDRQNVLAVVLDNSLSMAQSDVPGRTTRLQQTIAALEAGPLTALAKTFELRYFAFGGTLAPVDSLAALPPPDSQTHIGSALNNVLQTAGSVPMAGIILVSDGAENGQSLSEANLRAMAAYGVPIHTVGVGPESLENDLELVGVTTPQSVAPDAIVTADVNIRFTLPEKTATTRVRVYDGDRLLAAQAVQLSSAAARTPSAQLVRVEFPAGPAGTHDLKFVLEPLAGELNQDNNMQRQVLNVPSQRRTVLYIEGEPRWEYKFIRRALEGERAIRLVSVVRTTQNKLYRQGVTSAAELAAGLPTTAAELFAYDAIIIGSYEAAAFSAEQHELLKQFVDRRGGGVLLLAGRQGLGEGGWGNSALAETLPMHLTAKRSDDFLQGNVKAVPTRYGEESAALRLDAVAAKNIEQWQGLPELANYQRLGALKPGAIVLLEGLVKGDTAGKAERIPLLAWQRYGRGRTFVLATASTQRWQMSLPSDDQRHEMFWRQLMHALADGVPHQASVTTDRTVYTDERGVQIAVDVRDADYEFMHVAKDKLQMELSIRPEQGPSFVQALQPMAEQPGRYVASLDAVTPGLYTAELTARMADGQVLTTNTAFRRDDNVVEHFAAYQHRGVLERLAAETQGRYWRLDQLNELSAAIPYTKSGIVERQVLDLWNIPFTFALLLALKLGEWLLRLKWGTL